MELVGFEQHGHQRFGGAGGGRVPGGIPKELCKPDLVVMNHGSARVRHGGLENEPGSTDKDANGCLAWKILSTVVNLWR